MIQIGDTIIEFGDPYVIAAMIAAALVACFFLLIGLALRAANKPARAAEPLAQHLGLLSETVRGLSDGQQQLAGGLRTVSDTQIATQSRLMHTLESRLAEVQKNMVENLHGSATKTALSLGELQQRLATIDKAQTNIEKLSGDVLSLQDILSNKQTRGAFGEIQLNDIVSKALPPDAYAFQATLSNGKRADCLVHLPNPPGPIVIDSKFPLEAYEKLRNAKGEGTLALAQREMRGSVRAHIKAIAEKYIIEGETAGGALMFLPSEAVYAELHANFAEVVREGFDAKVWIVSPTTCMATLNTMRAVLKDARMREKASEIRRELGALHKDLDRLGERVGSLDRHFLQAAKDIEDIKISGTKAGTRAHRLQSFEFDEPAIESPESVVQLSRIERT
jgi:DNA recombination protein RmuC